MAGMVDDEATFRGELRIANASVGALTVLDNVEKRMGWQGGVTKVGSVGKAIQTMGMARVSLLLLPNSLLTELGAYSPSALPLQ